METRFEGRSQEEIDEALASLAGVRDRVLDRARLEPDDVVLDVGTGTGLLVFGALSLARAGRLGRCPRHLGRLPGRAARYV